MAILGKKQMSEEDIKLNYITPVIQRGWKGHITMETKITDGRINIRGNIVARSKPKYADYLLYLNDGKPIAVVEAKDNNHSVSHGLQQAMTYAQMMDLPFAYSSNGDAFYEHDFLTGQEQQIALEKFPTQDELVARYYAELNGGKGISDLEKKIVSQPYYSSQSTYPPRYYQRNAVNPLKQSPEDSRGCCLSWLPEPARHTQLFRSSTGCSALTLKREFCIWQTETFWLTKVFCRTSPRSKRPSIRWISPIKNA